MSTPDHRDLRQAGTTALNPGAEPPGAVVAPAPGLAVASEIRSARAGLAQDLARRR